MMDAERFKAILPGIVAQTVQVLIERHGWIEDDALDRFMRSKVYRMLSDEGSKVWHFSPFLLADLYEEEVEGCLEWPDHP